MTTYEPPPGQPSEEPPEHRPPGPPLDEPGDHVNNGEEIAPVEEPGEHAAVEGEGVIVPADPAIGESAE